jgi:hypothetical protein
MVKSQGALVFNATNALEFQDIRTNVIRIPEVIQSIREAQGIWDAVNPMPFDLTNFISSEDHVFMSQIKLKNLAQAVVQVGLLRRYLKYNILPDILIGTVHGDSPLKVALEQMSFIEMVAESDAIPRERLTLVKDTPMLSGVRLEEYAVFEKTAPGRYQRIDFETRDVRKMVETLTVEKGIDQVIFVGPGGWSKPLPNNVHTVESIDLDPHLSWFWAHARESKLAVAN